MPRRQNLGGRGHTHRVWMIEDFAKTVIRLLAMDHGFQGRPPDLCRLCPGKRRVPKDSDSNSTPAPSTLDTPAVLARDGFPCPQVCVQGGSPGGSRWRYGCLVTPHLPTPDRGELRSLGGGSSKAGGGIPYSATPDSRIARPSPLQGGEGHGVRDIGVAHYFKL